MFDVDDVLEVVGVGGGFGIGFGLVLIVGLVGEFD